MVRLTQFGVRGSPLGFVQRSPRIVCWRGYVALLNALSSRFMGIAITYYPYVSHVAVQQGITKQSVYSGDAFHLGRPAFESSKSASNCWIGHL